jgi:F0F1-type ATP synthase assembly protein I
LDTEPSRKEDEAPAPDRGRGQNLSQQFAVVMELPFVLVSPIVVGGLAGYFLDRWLHTMPWLMIVLGGLGFCGGLREVMRRLPDGKDGSGKGS